MHRLNLLVCTTLLAATASGAEARHAHMKWMAGPPGLPAGSTFTVVKGDPSKAGEFAVRVKMPANYTVAPHHHPTDEIVRVLSGGPLHYGMGDKLDKANAATLEHGYHITLKADMNHWAYTENNGATIQVSGMGPFQIVYVDPKDDPRTK